jgi:translation initiation factor IF-2
MKKGRKKSQSGKLRPPIVTVLGHVDHGKTTLLDKIRKTNVVAREAGGITQSIGASVVETPEGKKITFIDTPGHEAFSKMRARGAKVADIAILVVAGDAGVKPQTKEALAYIKDAKIPFIVAASKIDLPTADVKKVQSQLEKEGVSFEGRGGDVPLVGVSGKTGKGVEELLEMISLVSEVNEIKGDAKSDLEGVVIETSKDKRGPQALAVITNGTLRIGSNILAEDVSCRVRGLFDDKGKPTKEVKPGEPALILGFSKLPPVGSKIKPLTTETKVYKEERRRPDQKELQEGKIPIVAKAKSSGSLEALLANLPEEVKVIYQGVGDVNESDVFMAKSAIPARIFAFESKVPSSVAKLAETEGVKVEMFDVIYKLLERLEQIMEQGKEKVLGKAEILATFPFNDKKVAGCKVLQGRIAKSDNLVIMQGDRKLGDVKITSMKKEKQNIDKAQTNEEFGIIFTSELDFKVGDMLISVRK